MFAVPFMFSPAYRLAMSFKRVATAADLVRFGAALRIECGDCDAAQTLSGVEVVTRCGAGSLDRIRQRLVCARCGRRAARLVVLPPV